MASCVPTLHLDRAGPFVAGTSVTGRLIVRADDDVHVDGSKVSLAFETRGPGAVHRSPELASTTGPFDLAAGEERSIPFELELPAEPITIAGTVVGVAWILRAELDVPWALDPAADVEIIVDGPTRAVADVGPPAVPEERDDAPVAVATPTATAMPRPTPLAYAPYVLLVAAIAFVAVRLSSSDLDAPRASGGPEMLLFLAVAAYFVWRFAGRGLLNRYAAQGLGEPQVRASTERALRGEAVAVTVTIDPPADVELACITAKLLGTETAHSGGGRDRRSHEHLIEGDRVQVSGATTVGARASRRFEGALRVPQGASPSFEAPNNFIGWEIEVVVARPGGIDHVTRLPLHVAA